MSANGDGSLEEQLRDAGNRLQQPQPSVEELISLLDEIACRLSTMDSASPESIEATLSPLPKALAANELIWHSNIDVNVAAASCLCELLRITAPDPPYQDNDTLNFVLEVIVHCLKGLSDTSSPSHNKRIKILETVADNRLGALMMDFECDVLIAEMFDTFIEIIRDDQPENFFSLMETTMTDVIELYEDDEDIPTEILAPLLAALKKDNQEVLPIAVNLAKNVIETCADKLRPHLIEAMKFFNTSPDDYIDFVTAICEEISSPIESDDESDPPASYAYFPDLKWHALCECVIREYVVRIRRMPDGKMVTVGQASELWPPQDLKPEK